MSIEKAVDAVMRIDFTKWGRMSNSPSARSGRGPAKAKIVLYIARYTYGAGRPNGFLTFSVRKAHAQLGVHLRDAGELINELVDERVLERPDWQARTRGRADGLRVNALTREWRVPWIAAVMLHVEQPLDGDETGRAVEVIYDERGRAVKMDTARDVSRDLEAEAREVARATEQLVEGARSIPSSKDFVLRDDDELEIIAKPVLEAIERRIDAFFGEPRAKVLAALQDLDSERIGRIAREVDATTIHSPTFLAGFVAKRARSTESHALAIDTSPPPACAQCGDTHGPLLGNPRLCVRCYDLPCQNGADLEVVR